jgi:hypothetical protein
MIDPPNTCKANPSSISSFLNLSRDPLLQVPKEFFNRPRTTSLKINKELELHAYKWILPKYSSSSKCSLPQPFLPVKANSISL